MCQFGMMTPDARGEPTPAKEHARCFTNSPCLAEKLERHCPGPCTNEPLLGGRAKAAQVHPPKLCAAIVAGFVEQYKLDLKPISATNCEANPKLEPCIFNFILQVDQEDVDCRDSTVALHSSPRPTFLPSSCVRRLPMGPSCARSIGGVTLSRVTIAA